MATLISAAVAAPDFFLPRLGLGLALSWRAADLSGAVADGAPVTSWTSRAGNLTPTHGTFGFVEGGWSAPVFDADGGPGGRPCLSLIGPSRFKTFAGANGGPATGLTAITVSMVARWRNSAVFADSIGQRLLAGSLSNGRICTIRPSGSQRVYWGATAATAQSLMVGDLTGWRIVTLVSNGAASMFKVSGQETVTGTANQTGTETFKGLCLNMEANAAAPGDLSPYASWGMDVAAIDVWSRPVNPAEIEAQHQVLAAQFGLAA